MSARKGEDKRPNAVSRFAAKAVLLGSLMLAACTPDVNVKIIEGNADAAPDTAVCRVVALDTAAFSGGSLTLLSIDDKDGTKAANLELAGCGGKAQVSLKASETVTLTIKNESDTVQAMEIVYESNGPRVRVKVTPVDNTVRNDASVTSDVAQVQADAPVVVPVNSAVVAPDDAVAVAPADAAVVAPVDTAAAPVDSGNSKVDSGASG
jgi:hypothetical protein